MYRSSGFAVDRFRLAGMFAIPAMRTGFLIESYTEERVAREKTQQSSDRADRITEQSSAENSHDDENKQCDGCYDQTGNRHGTDCHMEQRVVVHFHQQVGEYVIPHITIGRNRLAAIRPKLLYGSKSRHNSLRPKTAMTAVITSST